MTVVKYITKSAILTTLIATLPNVCNAILAAANAKINRSTISRLQPVNYFNNDMATPNDLEVLMVGGRGVGKSTIANAWISGHQQRCSARHKTTKTVDVWKYPVEQVDNDEEHDNDDNGDIDGGKNSRDVWVYELLPLSENILMDTDDRTIMEYVRSARVVVVVFDITKPKTLQDALKWKIELEKYTRPGVNFVLLMNKLDEAHDRETLARTVTRREHMTNKETGFGNFFTDDDLARVKPDETLMYNWATVLSSFCKRHGFATTQWACKPLNGLPVSSYEYLGMDESFRYMYVEALEHYENVGNEIKTPKLSPLRKLAKIANSEINVKMYLILPLFILAFWNMITHGFQWFA